MDSRLLVITPVDHINGIKEILESFSNVTYLEDPSLEEVVEIIGSYEAIFTNPNKSKVFIGKDLMDAGINLKCICTASTGTNHIDKDYAYQKDLPVISLTEEREVINKISSTAELAFALTMSSVRKLVASHIGALKGEWDYSKFIGRQMDSLTIGVVGYGRLGKFYASFFKPFGSKVIVYDPYKKVVDFQQIETLQELVELSDVISLHVHVNKETTNLINSDLLKFAKKNLHIINTSRGEIVNEKDMVFFLKENEESRIASDVLSDEIRNKKSSVLLDYSRVSNQVLLTQHIGGMTQEAQEIAYGHAARLLKKYFKQGKTDCENE